VILGSVQTSLPVTTGTGFFFDASGGASKRLFIGDGTGYNFYFTKRLSSSNTDLFTFADSGTFTTHAAIVAGTTIQSGGALSAGTTVSTAAPVGGAGLWELGIANAVSPTSPNRTITIEIGGTAYYLAAKTTND
jgi:hypothetical protein